MVDIELDGQKVSVAPGSMVMHAAEQAGVYVPHFCYHKKLSIAANCRMCLVEVEKAPKPMPACATPVTQGMVVRTKSDKAIKAQQSVMEFLLINHPLDCPSGDQGGECQLQDLAVGYGSSGSRYEEDKRVVPHKSVGPLISMEEMSRCIHCTRCVRFGQEIAGVMELGMSHRGEHSEIETFVGQSVDSELSGNMIDLCPVGALTSKPFRYSARTWEMSRRKSISPHDSTGANLVVQIKNHRVMRVVPFENEAVNECWIADRDRFSYEALNSSERLTRPMIKQGGEWKEVTWQVALEYVANGLHDIAKSHGAESIGCLASPHSTVEELFLAASLVRGLGSDNIDHRLRRSEFLPSGSSQWLGTTIASLSQVSRALVIGSNLRKDHPLFALRLRKAVRHGARLHVLHNSHNDWAMSVASFDVLDSKDWTLWLAKLAAAVASLQGIDAPADIKPDDASLAVAESLMSGDSKTILLGNTAAHHPDAETLLTLAHWIGQRVGASVGYLCEAANTVGAQIVKAQPVRGGLDAGQMLSGGLKAALLLQVEPGRDTSRGEHATAAIAKSQMVVTMSPFRTNLDCSDVLLPVSPFSETAGSFVNAEGRLQSFHAVVKPLGETRPAWKVLRVLGEMLGVGNMAFESSAEVLQAALPGAASGELIPLGPVVPSRKTPLQIRAVSGQPVSVGMYQLDPLVRRSPSLQATADGKAAGLSETFA